MKTSGLLALGAALGLLGGNVYRRRMRQADFTQEKERFSRPQSQWTDDDARAYERLQRRNTRLAVARDMGNELLTRLTFGVYHPESLYTEEVQVTR